MSRNGLQRLVEDRYRVKVDKLTDLDIVNLGQKIMLDIGDLRDRKNKIDRGKIKQMNIIEHIEIIKGHIKALEGFYKF